MTLDEHAIAGALGNIEVAVPVDFVDRVRAGGRRRVLRRRAGAGAVVVAAGAVAVPAVVVVGSGNGSRIEPTQRQHIYPGLYAAPPTPGSQCNSSGGGAASPADYPELLLLPPAGQKDSEVSFGLQTWGCVVPHVALTALKLQGSSVEAGVVVEGPDAPTPTEVNEAGPGVQHGTPPDSSPILGQPATEFTFGNTDHRDVYWTEPDGGQWHATVRGLSESATVELLDGLTLNSEAGSASLPAAQDGWQVEPAVSDAAPSDQGALAAAWTDAQGHRATLNVTQGPDRVDQFAVGAPAGQYQPEGYDGSIELTTVRGHPAAFGPGAAPTLFWQEAPDVEVGLIITGASGAEIKQVAESLSLASPTDPRFGAG